MKTLIVYDGRFPYRGTRPSREYIEILKTLGDVVPPDKVAQMLFENEYAAIVNLHGAYVLKDSWKEILAHLRGGRGLVNIGGSSLKYPVTYLNGAFRIEREQTAYHRDLNIRNVFESEGEHSLFEVNENFGLDCDYASLFDQSGISEFTVKFTHAMDKPHEHGSSGPMEANIHALAYAISDDGRRLAAPLVMIENTRGSFAGGRWIFHNQDTGSGFWNLKGIGLIRDLIDMASRPVTEIIARPGFASYYPGERPVILLQYQLLGKGAINAEFHIKINKDGKNVYIHEFNDLIENNIKYKTIPADINAEEGFYDIELYVDSEGEKRIYKTGFWGFDRGLLETGSRLLAKGDYFTKDGKVFPVTGMTYMASDVHRKFLFIPNLMVWMEDFSFMKKAGINLVRTGTWTSFRNVMYVDGIAYEEVMRAIDAFILCAKYYDIEVIFNFFAFTPEMWEGVNPYLDPKSIEAQKRYINAIVGRHAASTNVSWDLINEPSVCNPERVFRGPQPNRDKYEISEWRTWLRDKYGTIGNLQEKWNLSIDEVSSFDEVMLPSNKDLIVVEERNDVPHPPQDRIKALMVMDYALFTNHVLDKWANDMSEAIRKTAPGQLVAIGQDHATSGRRPHPFFHGRFMDYTTVHTWWQLDDIYWDSTFVKIPGKPALVQETGVMYVEDNNEKYRRTEAELRDILERKLAYAFAANTAGVVPWILNTNIYMDDENEVHIGMLRPDLTEKPEFQAVRGIYRFIGKVKDIFENVMREDVYVIYSFSNSYSNRSYANIATRKCSRILAYNLKTTFFGCGDYDMSHMDNPKLIIYPSPRVIPAVAWEALMGKVESGSTVLLTGPINFDENWAYVGRSCQFGLSGCLKHVSREETVTLDGSAFRAVFDGQLIGWVDKETIDETGYSQLYSFEIGRGRLLWCPLPIEMNREDALIEEVYRKALSTAGMGNDLELAAGGVPGVFVKKMEFGNGSIYIAISEDGADRMVKIKDRANGADIEFELPANRSVMIAVDKNGSMIDSYGL